MTRFSTIILLLGVLFSSLAYAVEQSESSGTDTVQWLMNALFVLAGVFGGWVLNLLQLSIRDIKKSHAELHIKVHAIDVLVAGQYVRKDELASLSTALFAKLDKIENKIDNKADKADKDSHYR